MNDERMDEIISEEVSKIEPMSKNYAASIYAKYEEKRIKKRHFFIGLVSYTAVACAAFVLCFTILFPIHANRKSKAPAVMDSTPSQVAEGKKSGSMANPQQDYLYFSTKSLGGMGQSKTYLVANVQNIESLYFEIGEVLVDVSIDGDGFIYEEIKNDKKYLVIEDIGVYDVITLTFKEGFDLSVSGAFKAFVNGLDTGYYYNFKY